MSNDPEQSILAEMYASRDMGEHVAKLPDNYAAHRAVLIEYMKIKVEMEDWHGVSDAANDLRELDAEHRGRQR